MPSAPAKLPALEWRPQASADLMDIVAYIADDNPDAAQALKDEIEAKAAKLPRNPKLYKRMSATSMIMSFSCSQGPEYQPACQQR